MIRRDELINKLQAEGLNVDEKKELAAFFAPMANRIANGNEDSFHDGMIAVMKLINEYPKDDFFIKKVSQAIRWACGESKATEHTIPIPPRTYRYLVSKGLNKEKTLSPKIIRAYNNAEISEENLEILIKIPPDIQEHFISEAKKYSTKNLKILVHRYIQEHLEWFKRNTLPELVAQPEEARLEFRELLNKSVSSPFEGLILELRSQSYSLEEIAERVPIGKSRVHQIIEKIKNQFEAYNEP